MQEVTKLTHSIEQCYLIQMSLKVLNGAIRKVMHSNQQKISHAENASDHE